MPSAAICIPGVASIYLVMRLCVRHDCRSSQCYPLTSTRQGTTGEGIHPRVHEHKPVNRVAGSHLVARPKKLNRQSTACTQAFLLTMVSHAMRLPATQAGLSRPPSVQTRHCDHLQAVCCMLCVPVKPADAATGSFSEELDQTIVNVPNSLSSGEDSLPLRSLSKYFEGPKKRQIQQCTKTCVTTCTRGGAGTPMLHEEYVIPTVPNGIVSLC